MKKEVALKLADLEIQSMIFDMDIDIEALRLTPKNNYKEPFWLSRWKEKCQQSDNRPEDPDNNWEED